MGPLFVMAAGLLIILGIFGLVGVIIAKNNKATAWERRYWNLFDSTTNVLRTANLDTTTYTMLEDSINRSKREIDNATTSRSFRSRSTSGLIDSMWP